MSKRGERMKDVPRRWLRRVRALPYPVRMLILASFVTRAGMFVFPLLSIYLVKEKDYSVASAGVLLSIGSTGLLAGSVLSGPVCNFAGRRAALVASLVLNAVGYAGLVLTTGSTGLYAGLLFTALVGMGMFAPAANTLIADLSTPAQRSFAYTLSYVANNLGMGIGPLLGGLAATYSYDLTFVGNIGVGLVCAVLLWRVVPAGTGPDRSGEDRRSLRLTFRGQWGVAALVLVSALYIIPLIGLEYALPLAATTVLLTSTALVGAVYTINSAVVVGVGLLMEHRIARCSPRPLLLAAGALWTAGMAGFALFLSVPGVLASTAVWTVGEIIVSVVVPTYIANQASPGTVSSLMALNGFVLGAVRFTVPVGLGYVWAECGYRTAIYLLVAAPLLGMLTYTVIPARAGVAEASHAPANA